MQLNRVGESLLFDCLINTICYEIILMEYINMNKKDNSNNGEIKTCCIKKLLNYHAL